MAIARVTVLDFADEESKKRNLQLYEQRWKEVFPNMHMNMIISTGPTSFLSISVYENDLEAEANMEGRTKLHEDFTNIKDDLDMLKLFSKSGLSCIEKVQMPANNLAFVLKKDSLTKQLKGD